MRRMIQQLKNYFDQNQKNILADIEELVRLESPSKDAAGINKVIDVVQNKIAPLGGVATRHHHELGDVLHVRIPGANTDARTVLLSHADTVYPHGAWQNIWHIEGENAFGPGAYDMKGGIVQALWALRGLHKQKIPLANTVDFLLTPDEEIASHAGKPFIEQLATGASNVLVLEPPHLDGNVKVARKGVGGYRIFVHGKAAHQGTEPENGRNAIVAAAQLITEIMKLQDLEKGTSLGPNVISGGTAMNVVADHVAIEVDLRVWSESEAARVDAAIKKIIAPTGIQFEILDGLNRPPMEPTAGTWALFERAKKLCEALGLPTGAARVGGGSDGNFTSKLAPTIDGFGVFGANAHQRNQEHIHIPSLSPRTSLLAGMLAGL